MVVEELYNLMEKKSDKYTHWNFTVYVDGINNNILAYANNHYDVEGSIKLIHYMVSRIYSNMKSFHFIRLVMELT